MSSRVVQHPHGVLVAVAIDGSLDAGALHPDEFAIARELRGERHKTFVAGRVALGRALAAVGAPRVAILRDERGGPVLPPGFVGSISHKGDRAIAIAAVGGEHLGVDLELVRPIRGGVAEAVLTVEERARLGDDPLFTTLASFSVKESVYKAIAPTLRRYVGFHEAVVTLPSREEIRATFARVEVRLMLSGGEPAPHLEATVTERDGEIVSTARIVAR